MNLKTVLYTFILLGVLTQCQVQEEPSETSISQVAVNQVLLSQEQLNMAGIEVGKAERRVLKGGINCTGTIDVPPQNLATICTPIGGFVKKLHHIPGEYVSKGSPVAIIEHPNIIDIQQDYLVSKGKLMFLESEYLRKQKLIDKDATAQKAYEEATSNFLVEQANLLGLKARLNLMGIKPESLDSTGIQTEIYIPSPLSGYVTEVQARRGQYVSPEMPLVSVVDKAHIHLELSIFAQDISKIKKGQSITFQIPGNSELYHGEVYLLGHLVEEESKSLNIHGHIHDKDPNRFIPGTYINATIQTDADTVWAIPSEAMVRQGNQAFVFVRSDSTFHKREIEIGNISDGWVEVTSIKDTDMNSAIAVKGAYYLQGSL